MAATERSRRTTAGKRMTFLTGQAQEDDDAFWGHDTWESDNESFRSVDQDDAPDVFDSDFNETEESSDEEVAVEAEKEIVAEERMHDRKRKAATGYSERSALVPPPPGGGGAKPPARFGKPSSVGANKRIKGSSKRIFGDGHNAGIVLNLPQHGGEGSNGGTAAVAVATNRIGRPKKAPSVAAWSSSAAGAGAGADGQMMAPILALAARRERRSAREASGYSTEAREIAAASAAAAALAAQQQRKQVSPTKSTTTTTTKAKGQDTFQQSDLLLEAVNDTEPNNERWLLGRKRIQAERELTNADKGDPSNTTYTEKFVSRRGYLNTINFVDMDRIPPILLQKKTSLSKLPPKVPLCAITGQPARYRDPKSGYGYYDLAAFRAIRARWETEQRQRRAETEQVTAEPAKKKRGKKANGKKNAVLPTTDEAATTPPPPVAANKGTASAADSESTSVPFGAPPLVVSVVPTTGSTANGTTPAVVMAPKRRKAGRPKAAAKDPASATPLAASPPVEAIPVLSTASIGITPADTVMAPKRKPGRPKGTAKKTAARLVVDTGSTSNTCDPATAIAVTAATTATTSAALSTTTAISLAAAAAAASAPPPSTVAAQASPLSPPPLSPSLQSSLSFVSTMPSPATTQPPTPADQASRKSPRRRKPTARMLECIDEGLFPALPESTTTTAPLQDDPSLEPRHPSG
jgi:YL1 nuclear protein/YL1 nuclear protein C-terminal domain